MNYGKFHNSMLILRSHLTARLCQRYLGPKPWNQRSITFRNQTLLDSSTKQICPINSSWRSFVAHSNKTCPSKSLLLPGFTVNKRISQGPSSATVSSCLSMSWPVFWSNEVAFALREIIDMCDTSINKSAPRESCQQPINVILVNHIINSWYD